MSVKYKLFVINSSKSIKLVLNFLTKRTSDIREIGPIKKDFSRDALTREYIEKTKRLAILDNNLYLRLINLGYGVNNDKNEDFEISQFQISNEDYAHRRSSVMHFYFPIDKSGDNASIILKKMEYFTKMNIIDKDDWFIHNDGVCEFSPNVKETTKVIMKIMVDNPSEFRVSWCRTNLFFRIRHHFPGNRHK